MNDMRPKKQQFPKPKYIDQFDQPVYDTRDEDDIHEEFMERMAARERHLDRPNQPVTIKAGSTMLDVLPDQSQMEIVFEVEPSPKMLEQCRRVLKPIGRVIYNGVQLQLPPPPPKKLVAIRPKRVTKRSKAGFVSPPIPFYKRPAA